MHIANDPGHPRGREPYAPAMSEFSVRRVVTGFDATGAEVFTHDGQAPNTVDAGPVGVSEVFWTDGSGLRTSPTTPTAPPRASPSSRPPGASACG